MKMRRGIAVGAGLAVVLAGCATIEDGMQQRAEAIPEGQRAYVAGSFRIACIAGSARCSAPFNAMSTFYRNVSNPSDRGMTLRYTEGGVGGNTTPDFIDVERGEKGVFFCHVVAAGDYSVFSYRYANFAGGGSVYTLPEQEQFDVPFSVAAGEVVYVGDIKQTYSSGSSLMGMPTRRPGVIELSPGNPAEARAAMAKCPEAAQGLPLRSAPLEASADGSPLVVVKDAD